MGLGYPDLMKALVINCTLKRSPAPLVIASPTWLGRPSSVTQRVLERMDAMLAETDDEERPVARPGGAPRGRAAGLVAVSRRRPAPALRRSG
ncbi:hypothetical protein GCM10010503_23280 [Streptomyces lucensis JCM 4490]|uniref:Uncharacterized protein n=1 Tax=Streptomyces lucensis JCM 4490 TaxID=1306176 RepID=A0A918MR31_9ACTN|nr:hypothetical protein GCM10010503_23280 [Streptomyces lucensis JCM 4490]